MHAVGSPGAGQPLRPGKDQDEPTSPRDSTHPLEQRPAIGGRKTVMPEHHPGAAW